MFTLSYVVFKFIYILASLLLGHSVFRSFIIYTVSHKNKTLYSCP